jgi:hypothetical protein
VEPKLKKVFRQKIVEVRLMRRNRYNRDVKGGDISIDGIVCIGSTEFSTAKPKCESEELDGQSRWNFQRRGPFGEGS